MNNHIDGKVDVSCATEVATNEDGPSVFERTHTGTHDRGNACQRGSNRIAWCCEKQASEVICDSHRGDAVETTSSGVGV